MIDTLMLAISKLRGEITTDDLDQHAEEFEQLLGNWLCDNPQHIKELADDPSWEEELELDLPIDYKEFIANVQACVKAAE